MNATMAKAIGIKPIGGKHFRFFCFGSVIPCYNIITTMKSVKENEMAQTLRQQFDIQLRNANFVSNLKGLELDIVIVTHPKYATRISVLGNAISRAAYDCWKRDGSNVRLLRVIKPTRGSAS